MPWIKRLTNNLLCQSILKDKQWGTNHEYNTLKVDGKRNGGWKWCEHMAPQIIWASEMWTGNEGSYPASHLFYTFIFPSPFTSSNIFSIKSLSKSSYFWKRQISISGLDIYIHCGRLVHILDPLQRPIALISWLEGGGCACQTSPPPLLSVLIDLS